MPKLAVAPAAQHNSLAELFSDDAQAIGARPNGVFVGTHSSRGMHELAGQLANCRLADAMGDVVYLDASEGDLDTYFHVE